jgi:hypothetical protein
MKFIVDDNYSIPEYILKMPPEQLEKEIKEYEREKKSAKVKSKKPLNDSIQPSPPTA